MSPAKEHTNDKESKRKMTAKKDSKLKASKNSFTLDEQVRFLSIIFLDPANRAALKNTGAKASRKDLDSGDAKKLGTWTKFAEIMGDTSYQVTPGHSSVCVLDSAERINLILSPYLLL